MILLGAYRFLLGPYVGLSIRRLVPELGPALVGCLALAAVTVPAMRLLEGALPRVLLIALVAGAGLAAYTLVLRLAFPAAWGDARLLVVQVLGPLGRRLRRGRSVVAAEPPDHGPAAPIDAAKAVAG